MDRPQGSHDAALAALPQAERQAVSAIFQKLIAKQPLTRDEKSQLARFERQREERLRWQYYRRIPKKHWQEMSGRQAKVLNEQAARYGLPLEGAYIDLTKLARALHDFLAKHAAKLAQEDDPMLRSANSSPALERYREEKARLAQLDRLEREGSLITLDKACAVIDRLAVHVRQAGELIARDYGQQAAEILIEAIERFQGEFRSAVTDKQPAS